ncbi:MAG: glycosyltransferase family 39 protein [Desulfobacteraceae bacterium]
MIVEKTDKWTQITTFFLHKKKNQSILDGYSDEWFCLGIPLLISLAVKLILLSELYQSTINMDGILYINAAQQFAAGSIAKGLAMYPMPAYPLLIAFVHILIPDWIFAGYMISIMSMVLTVIPLYCLTKYMFGTRAAFWTCLVFALMPKINEWSLYVSRDPIFLLIFAWCIYSAVKSIETSDFSYFWFTFIIGWCSVLIRIEGIIFIFFYFGVLICLSFTHKEQRTAYLVKSLTWAGLPLVTGLTAILTMGSSSLAVNRLDQVIAELINFFNGNFLDLYFQIYEIFKTAENYPPFSGLHYNAAALARHYLLIIYLMGMAEVLIKVIFPLSCIPLYIALKERLSPPGRFILCLWSLYMGLIFYFLLTRDFLSTRFLMIPAFLLLPWIGEGIDRLCRKINTASRKKSILFLIAVLILAPGAKSFELLCFNDNAIPIAVNWLDENNMLGNIEIATNEKKLSFYIDPKNKKKPLNTVIHYSREIKNYKDLEKFALKNNTDILLINLHNKNKEKIPDFNCFKKIHLISGDDDLVQIYSRSSCRAQ